MQPPDDLREPIIAAFDPLPAWHQPLAAETPEFPLDALRQRLLIVFTTRPATGSACWRCAGFLPARCRAASVRSPRWSPWCRSPAGWLPQDGISAARDT